MKPIPINKRFAVQFEFPCEDPLNNVRVTLRKGVPTFLVPANHPIAHHMGLTELIHAVNLGESLDLFTTLNNTNGCTEKKIVVAKGNFIDTAAELARLRS